MVQIDLHSIVGWALLLNAALFLVFGGWNSFRRIRLLKHGGKGGKSVSTIMFGLFRILFLPVSRSPLTTLLLSTAVPLALLWTNFNHYFQGSGSSLFGTEYYAALLSILAFLGSAILSASSFNAERIHTDERAIRQEILECADAIAGLAHQIVSSSFPKAEVLSCVEELQELRTNDIKRVKVFESTHGIVDAVEEIADQRFSDPLKYKFCGWALRLENASHDATLTYIRHVANVAIWVKMASTLFAYLVVLLAVMIVGAVWKASPIGGFSDAIFLAICTATGATVADFISFQLQETED